MDVLEMPMPSAAAAVTANVLSSSDTDTSPPPSPSYLDRCSRHHDEHMSNIDPSTLTGLWNLYYTSPPTDQRLEPVIAQSILQQQFIPRFDFLKNHDQDLIQQMNSVVSPFQQIPPMQSQPAPFNNVTSYQTPPPDDNFSAIHSQQLQQQQQPAAVVPTAPIIPYCYNTPPLITPATLPPYHAMNDLTIPALQKEYLRYIGGQTETAAAAAAGAAVSHSQSSHNNVIHPHGGGGGGANTAANQTPANVATTTDPGSYRSVPPRQQQHNSGNRSLNSYKPSIIKSVSFACDAGPAAAVTTTPSRLTVQALLVRRLARNPSYATKIFVGGLPASLSMDDGVSKLETAFSELSGAEPGNVRVEWPEERRLPGMTQDSRNLRKNPRFAYVRFDECAQPEECVRNVLVKCDRTKNLDFHEYHCKVQAVWCNDKVEIIPWLACYSTYYRLPHLEVKNDRTVFVGGLHGLITAETLADIFQEQFKSVVGAHIDTDRLNRYPIGSGRVIFSSEDSYRAALNAHTIQVRTCKFIKDFQIEPFIEENVKCGKCESYMETNYCRDCCLHYCTSCFNSEHRKAGFESHFKVSRHGTERKF